MRTVEHLLILAAFGSLLSSCDADAPTPPPVPATEQYHQPTSPDSVVANLILAHKNRDLGAYTALVAPEFKFFFVPLDVDDVGAESWNKTQDSIGTAALFHEATDIDLTARPTVAEDADPNVFPPGTKRVHLHSVEMTVCELDGITWVVTTDQDLYLRPGNATAGEDSAHWFLSEWHEIDSITAPDIEGPTAGSPATWGRMKYQYLLLTR